MDSGTTTHITHTEKWLQLLKMYKCYISLVYLYIKLHFVLYKYTCRIKHLPGSKHQSTKVVTLRKTPLRSWIKTIVIYWNILLFISQVFGTIELCLNSQAINTWKSLQMVIHSGTSDNLWIVPTKSTQELKTLTM